MFKNIIKRITVASVLFLLLCCGGGGGGDSSSSGGSLTGEADFGHPFSVWGTASIARQSTIPQEMVYMDDLGIKAFKSNIVVVWGLVDGKDLNDINTWKFGDTLVDEAAKYNIEPILTLSPLKQTGNSNELPKTPEELEAYREYIQATVSRYTTYKNKVDTWQIVNELSDHWKDTAENYAELLRVTVEEVRKIQPEAKFVLAAPATSLFESGHSDPNFLEQVLKALEPYGKGWFDYLDIHFIGQGHPSENKHIEMIKWHSYFKDVLTEYGYADVSFFAEINSYGGVDTEIHPDITYVSEKEQAVDLLGKYFVGAALGFDQIHSNGEIIEGPYSITGTGGQQEGRIYDALVYNPDPEVNPGRSSKKLAYYSLKKIIEKLEGFDKKKKETIKQDDDGIFIYEFIKNGKPIWVAWNDNADAQTVTLDVRDINSVKITEAVPKYETGQEVTDYNTAFNTETKAVSGGKVTITLGASPVFVEEQ